MATTGGAPSFERDIKPLFREDDREAMQYIFDLWDYDEVVANAENILKRLEDGSMPCDGEWPEKRVAQFRRWIDAGMLR
jgi:hypothetical protein